MTYQIKQLEEFADWLRSIRDSETRGRLVKRLRKASLGNLGDAKSVGQGVFEMREDFGPGWRMYYVRRVEIVIVMLGGGSKASQQNDINKAIARSKLLEE